MEKGHLPSVVKIETREWPSSALLTFISNLPERERITLARKLVGGEIFHRVITAVVLLIGVATVALIALARAGLV